MLEKFWALTVVVVSTPHHPPTARTPAPASSPGSSKLIRPAPALNAPQATSVTPNPPALRVPPLARIRLAVVGLVHAAVAVVISVSMLPLVNGCGRSVFRYQLTVVPLSAWRQRALPRSVNGCWTRTASPLAAVAAALAALGCTGRT